MKNGCKEPGVLMKVKPRPHKEDKCFL